MICILLNENNTKVLINNISHPMQVDSHVETSKMPCARAWHTATVYGNAMYILGGCHDSSDDQQFWKYTPDEVPKIAHSRTRRTGQWEQLPPAPIRLEGHCAVLMHFPKFSPDADAETITRLVVFCGVGRDSKTMTTREFTVTVYCWKSYFYFLICNVLLFYVLDFDYSQYTCTILKQANGALSRTTQNKLMNPC